MEKTSSSDKKVARRVFILFMALQVIIMLSPFMKKSVDRNLNKKEPQITNEEELTAYNYRRTYNPDKTFRYATDRGHIKRLIK